MHVCENVIMRSSQCSFIFSQFSGVGRAMKLTFNTGFESLYGKKCLPISVHRLHLKQTSNLFYSMNYIQALHFRLVEMDADEDDSRSFATQPKGLGPSDKVLTQESGKMVFLVSLLDNLKAEGHRCLVFSQSRKMLDIVQRVITHRVGRENCCACFF